jgi:hypothetical protein
MVVTGTKLEDDSHLASRKYVGIVQKLGFDGNFSSSTGPRFKILSAVATSSLAYSHGQVSSRQPELSHSLTPLFDLIHHLSFAAVSRSNLPHDQTQNHAAHLYAKVRVFLFPAVYAASLTHVPFVPCLCTVRSGSVIATRKKELFRCHLASPFVPQLTRVLQIPQSTVTHFWT